MRDNYILGAGISGLIAKFYNPDFKIITPKEGIGGQANTSFFPLGPRVLHKNSFNKRLLKDLCIDYKTKNIRMKYFMGGKMFDSICDKNKEKFIKNKKRKDFRRQTIYEEVKDNTLSVKNNFLEYYDVDFSEVINKLKSSISSQDIIYDKIRLISSESKELVGNNYTRYEYNKLISTIPAPEFKYICYDFKDDIKTKYVPVSYVLVNRLPNMVRTNGWNWLYCIDDALECSRVTKFGKKFVLEFTGVANIQYFKDNFPLLDVESSVVQRVGIIFSNELQDSNDIYFLGRLAQWNHKIKTQNVIEKSLEGFE